MSEIQNNKFDSNTLNDLSEGKINSLLTNSDQVRNKENILNNDENFRSFINKITAEKDELTKKIDKDYTDATAYLKTLQDDKKLQDFSIEYGKNGMKGEEVQKKLTSYEDAVKGLSNLLNDSVKNTSSFSKPENIGDHIKNLLKITKKETIQSLETNAVSIETHGKTVKDLQDNIKTIVGRVLDKKKLNENDKKEPIGAREIFTQPGVFVPDPVPGIDKLSPTVPVTFSLVGKDKAVLSADTVKSLSTQERQAIGQMVLSNGKDLRVVDTSASTKVAENKVPSEALLISADGKIQYSITQNKGEITIKQEQIQMKPTTNVNGKSTEVKENIENNAKKYIKELTDGWSTPVNKKISKDIPTYGIKAGDLLGVEEQGVTEDDFKKSDNIKFGEYMQKRLFTESKLEGKQWKVQANLKDPKNIYQKGDTILNELTKLNLKNSADFLKRARFNQKKQMIGIDLSSGTEKKIAALRIPPGTKTYVIDTDGASKLLSAKDTNKRDTDMRKLLGATDNARLFYANRGNTVFIRVMESPSQPSQKLPSSPQTPKKTVSKATSKPKTVDVNNIPLAEISPK